MSDRGSIRVNTDGAVAAITLDQPRRRNALTREMWGVLAETVRVLDTDGSVRVIVISGAGDQFSAGVDLHDLSEQQDLSQPFDVAGITSAAEDAIAESRTPVIAAIDGAAMGGGALIAVAADFRIASRRARIGFPPARLGLVYPANSVRHLTHLVGPARAKYLLLTADPIDAEEAHMIGLVERILPTEEFADGVRALAHTMTMLSPFSQAAAKRAVSLVVRGDEALSREIAEWTKNGHNIGELQEGVTAFIERRAADFPSKVHGQRAWPAKYSRR